MSSEPNEELRRRFDEINCSDDRMFAEPPTHFVIETMQWRGQPMYWQSIATLIWIGRLRECWERLGGNSLDYFEIVRDVVKLYNCGATARKDSHVRASIETLYGGKSAKGSSGFPGPLYGISKHAWQALGLGITWFAQFVGEADDRGARV
jgi:hypothetical protein